MHNELIQRTKVSWTLNEDAAKTVAVAIPAGSGRDSGSFVVAVKNGSAVVDLSIELDNKFLFDGTNLVAATLVASADFTVVKATAECKVVDGFLVGEAGQLILTKSAATAAAFDAYVEIRRA